mgnify:CR=1 FL=1
MSRIQFALVIILLMPLWSGSAQAELGKGTVTLAQKKSKRKRSSNSQRLYKKASKFYEQQKYDEAVSVYTRILRSYPGHTLSKLHLAKSLYRLEKISQAYQAFSQLDINTLDPESSYEYGQSHFKYKKWKAALKAFKRVPNGTPFFDLASYYGGYCALKLKQYSEAVELFNQAVVLPTKLMTNKATQQKQAESMMLLEQKKQLRKPGKPGPIRIKERPSKAKVKGKGSSKTATKGKPSSNNSQNFFPAENFLGFNADMSSQSQDFSGTKDSNANRSAFGAIGQLALDIPMSKKNHTLIQLNLESSSIERENEVVGLVEDFNGEARTMIINQSAATTFNHASLSIIPEISIGKSSWAALGLSYGFMAADGDNGKADAALPVVSFQLGRRQNSFSFVLGARYINLNLNEAQYLERTEQFIKFSRKLSQKLSLNLDGILNQFGYIKAETDGADWTGRLSGDLMYSVSQYFAVGLKGHYLKVGAYRLHQLSESLPVAELDYDSISAAGLLQIKIGSWLKLIVSGGFIDRKINSFSPTNDSTEAAINDVFQTYIVTTDVTLKASYKF